MRFVQLKSGEFCIVVSLLSQPFPHDTASWSAFVLSALSHVKMILRKPRSLTKPIRNEMEYGLGPFRSQHVAPV